LRRQSCAALQQQGQSEGGPWQPPGSEEFDPSLTPAQKNALQLDKVLDELKALRERQWEEGLFEDDGEDVGDGEKNPPNEVSAGWETACCQHVRCEQRIV
jgi:hypothetical protein